MPVTVLASSFKGGVAILYSSSQNSLCEGACRLSLGGEVVAILYSSSQNSLDIFDEEIRRIYSAFVAILYSSSQNSLIDLKEVYGETAKLDLVAILYSSSQNSLMKNETKHLDIISLMSQSFIHQVRILL